ncbi:ribokinase [Crocosphaera chwakensis]|uniref:Ribokinase n=1 Tax=Crocosphaera chwakensis CCY0110 TaxID=391612 RepID=A3IKI1_9CHRO|nr:ribokinase [Crocosphaera chwakensis]EAZ93170.1 Ribokinase [Crocosphaera chwakensis CCY0110]
MSIVVFGSINMDMIAQTPCFPQPGETITGTHFITLPGGKGANQAVATAKLGRSTYFVGRVGGDSLGRDLLKRLETFDINTQGVLIDKNTSSGVAMITVETSGENSIIVISGANGNINESDVIRLEKILLKASLLLLQLEIPLKAVEIAAIEAKKLGVTVMLDPAPAPEKLPDSLYPLIDIITPNQTEAAKLVGFPLSDTETIKKAAEQLLQKGVKIVIIKLGQKGAFYATENEEGFVAPTVVETIDTVGAGDGFNGGVAAALDRGLSLKEALKWGSVVGALTTTQEGAQTALPDLETVEQLIINN